MGPPPGEKSCTQAARKLHASFTQATRKLRANYTHATRKLHASCTPTPACCHSCLPSQSRTTSSNPPPVAPQRGTLVSPASCACSILSIWYSSCRVPLLLRQGDANKANWEERFGSHTDSRPRGTLTNPSINPLQCCPPRLNCGGFHLLKPTALFLKQPLPLSSTLCWADCCEVSRGMHICLAPQTASSRPMSACVLVHHAAN